MPLTDTPTLTRRLREAALRVTAPRLAVLAALEELRHPDAEEVRAAAQGRLGSLSTQGVYDILHAFTQADLVRRVEPAGSPARFETRVGDNHHHLVCRRCGVTRDVDCVVGASPCLTPSDPAGFVVDEAEVTFWGTCPDCQPAQGQKQGENPHDRRAAPPDQPSGPPGPRQPEPANRR